MEDFLQKVKSLTLDSDELAIAEYISDNYSCMRSKSIAELSENTGVSKRVILRFIRRLGFSVYSEFRSSIPDHGENCVACKPPSLNNGRRRIRAKEDEDILGVMNKNAMRFLNSTASFLSSEVINKTADIILSGKRVFIVGFDDSAGYAKYMADKLALIRKNIWLVTNGEIDAFKSALDIGQTDCLLIYAFPECADIESVLAYSAHKNNAQIIAITGKSCYLISKLADIVIQTHQSESTFSNSDVAPFFISESILFAINGKTQQGII